MKKTLISTPDAPQAIGPYSQAVEREGIVYCSGQIGLDPASGKLVEGGVRAETRQALSNLVAVLRAAGCTPQDVVKTTVYLANLADFAAMNEVYATIFGVEPPARSTIQAAALPRGAQVEIDAIAKRRP